MATYYDVLSSDLFNSKIKGLPDEHYLRAFQKRVLKHADTNLIPNSITTKDVDLLIDEIVYRHKPFDIFPNNC